MRFFLFSITLLICYNSGISQNNSFKTGTISVKKAGVVNLSGNEIYWMPNLLNIEMPRPEGEDKRVQLEKIKTQLRQKYQLPKYKKTGVYRLNSAQVPFINKKFLGNTQNSGVPNDNDVAISNDGKVVSVVNTSIYVFDINRNDTILLKKSLEAFAVLDVKVPKNNVNDDNSKYDPKVIYDPDADRFILVMLNGKESIYSKIIVAFSQTNDPTGLWNIYLLSGTPLNNYLWSDYPQIAMTKEDFFITINLLTDTASKIGGLKPWELAFEDNLIWQVKKEDGYNGTESLTTAFYHDIRHNNQLIQYLCPIKSGSNLEGPNMYFVSNKSFTLGNDSVFLTEITNSLSSGNAAIKVRAAKSNERYFVPPNASQKNSYDSLSTNDARILGGFLHNHQIQFVNTTLDTATGHSAIYHGIIKNITENEFEITGNTIGDVDLEFGYPNISYTGSDINYSGINSGENESIISFNYSSASNFPGMGVVFCDNNNNYSTVLKVKQGDTTINYFSAKGTERWGDYSGSQRKYNEQGKIWMAGTFGWKGTTNKQQRYGTWITEVSSPTNSISNVSKAESILFPNPSDDMFSLHFNLEEDAELSIKLYDLKGELVKDLLLQEAKLGQNIFSFSTAPLAKGLYLLSITSNKGEVIRKKIVKN